MNRFYATGRRKVSAARVWLQKGTGQITVNGESLAGYFRREVLQMIIKQPFLATETLGTYDATVTVTGGGLSGQAGAVRHGIARALQHDDSQNLGPALKRGGFLTRDARMVERKKYGQPGARKRFQYSKR
ncbi:MAG TPA: 30S ribosomal protein S9 [Myxococcota bacterium]|nr:30S ribosomal protein S9 [Myxococcota bacterium]